MQKYEFFLTFWFFHAGVLFFCMFAWRMFLVSVSCGSVSVATVLQFDFCFLLFLG